MRIITIGVWCGECKLWFEEKHTEFVDIEEDFEGRDVLTFICPECKTEQRSLRRTM
jgi:Zn finger protein HypA/HybF involved in hydrogenase expression